MMVSSRLLFLTFYPGSGLIFFLPWRPDTTSLWKSDNDQSMWSVAGRWNAMAG
jgi:hypothetical protein